MGARTRATRSVRWTGTGRREKLVRNRERIEEDLAEEAGSDGDGGAAEWAEVGMGVVAVAIEGSGLRERLKSSSCERTRGFCCGLEPGLISGLGGGIIGDGQ